MKTLVQSLLTRSLLILALGAPRLYAQQHQHPRPQSGPEEEGGYAQLDPHMKVTLKRPLKPEDIEPAEQIVRDTKRVMERFEDYRVALREGYRIFLPRLPLPEYHFTNYRHGFEAAFRLSIERPTSLLYAKASDGYRLTGVMLTAPASASLDDLDRRVPLSVAQWHLHVNFCMPPPDRRNEMWRPSPRFGLMGSISTAEKCQEAGGRFLPRLFGWMVHVYPYEEKREEVFRMPGHHQHGEGHEH